MSRLPRKSIAALIPVAFFAGAIAMRVGHDEARLVRTAGTSAPLVESSTTSTSTAPAADEPAKVAELDATVENHETRIRVLESTTTTAPAAQPAPTTISTVAPDVTADPSTTTTTATTPTTQPAPTTTTTRWLSAGMCPADHQTGLNPDGVYCAAPPAS